MMTTKRSFARSCVMRTFYSWEVGNDDDRATLDMMCEDAQTTLSSGQRAYIDAMLEGVRQHKDELDETISSLAQGWTAERLPKVDLAILRVGIYELKYCPDIPEGATINECVELAKEFSLPESGAYINGILSSCLKQKGEV